MADNGSSNGKPLAAYFLSLELENVRCFGERQRLNLARPDGRPARWTVLLGDNGVGKTTVLQCLAGMESTRLEPPQDEGPNNFPAFVNRRMERWKFARNNKLPMEFSVSAAISSHIDDHSSMTAGWEASIDGFGAFAQGREYSEMAELHPIGYGATRRFGRERLTSSESEASNTLFDESAELLSPEEWLLKLDYTAKSGSATAGTAKHRLEEAREALRHILPEITSVSIIPPLSASDSPYVAFGTPFGALPLRQLSLGYRTMAAWMIDLAARLYQRHPDSPNPLAEPAVVLVDEIDLHLHPRWQRNIMHFLSERFPNTQFIVTAHSPLIVQAAVDANIAVLRREGDQVVIDNSPESVRGWRIDQVLASDLFGIENVRSPDLDEAVRRRRELLQQPTLTENETAELAQLEARMDALPTGETREEMEAMEVIRRAAALLKERGLDH